MARKAMTMILAAMLLGGAATIPTMALARGGGHGGGGHFGRAIAVLEINDGAEITACTEYYDRTTMPIGEPTPFNHLTWPQHELFMPSTQARDVIQTSKQHNSKKG